MSVQKQKQTKKPTNAQLQKRNEAQEKTIAELQQQLETAKQIEKSRDNLIKVYNELTVKHNSLAEDYQNAKELIVAKRRDYQTLMVMYGEMQQELEQLKSDKEVK